MPPGFMTGHFSDLIVNATTAALHFQALLSVLQRSSLSTHPLKELEVRRSHETAEFYR